VNDDAVQGLIDTLRQPHDPYAVTAALATEVLRRGEVIAELERRLGGAAQPDDGRCGNCGKPRESHHGQLALCFPPPRPALEALRGIVALHSPQYQEVEVWIDGPGEEIHEARWPDCHECQGHMVAMRVCTECGYEHDGESPVFRPWPCPTLEALQAVLPDEKESP